MEQSKNIRKPKQSRSINTKDKILEAALKLFSEKGYYKTTTNEIAKVANVSIGSLYSYYKDKDTIFMEILEDYEKQFIDLYESCVVNLDLYESDKILWLRQFINSMIQIHEQSRELNIEIKILSYSRPDVAAISKIHSDMTRKMTFEYFFKNQEFMKVKDLEATSIVCYNIISSMVDYIAFENTDLERERLVDATVDALYHLLLE